MHCVCCCCVRVRTSSEDLRGHTLLALQSNVMSKGEAKKHFLNEKKSAIKKLKEEQ